VKQPKPPDFDWVAARHKCSAAVVFEALLHLAQQNVETANALRKSNGLSADAHVQATVPGVFAVLRGLHGPPHTVRFRLDREGSIGVDYQGVPNTESFTGTLTLNNDGECRLRVGTQELDLWQVLRLALEPLLFGMKDWEI
jgi:hypothetical protein